MAKWRMAAPKAAGYYWLFYLGERKPHIVHLELFCGKLDLSVMGNDSTWDLRDFMRENRGKVLWYDEPLSPPPFFVESQYTEDAPGGIATCAT